MIEGPSGTSKVLCISMNHLSYILLLAIVLHCMNYDVLCPMQHFNHDEEEEEGSELQDTEMQSFQQPITGSLTDESAGSLRDESDRGDSGLHRGHFTADRVARLESHVAAPELHHRRTTAMA